MPTAEAPPSPRRRRRARGRSRAALAALLAAAALAGCGSSASHGNGTTADPAGVIPSSAPIYLGATVRPSGSQAAAALAAGAALTHQADPFLRLLEVLRTPGSPALDYKREVAPWLGPHAGLFLRSPSGSSSILALAEAGLLGGASTARVTFGGGQAGDGAIVMDTRDASAAGSFLAKQARRAGAHPAGYRGLHYEVTGGGLAFGLVGRFAVIGSEPGLHAVIDTSLGAGALAGAAGYARLTGAAPSQAIAHLYLDPAAAPAARRVAGLLGALTGSRQVDVSLLAAAGSLTLDADTLPTPGAGGGLLVPDPEAVQAFGALPGDSWLALGLGHLATNLQPDVAALKGIASLLGSERASGLGTILEGLLQPVELLGAGTARARSDFGGWERSAGLFAAGAGLLELRGGIVIDSSDAARSRAAVAKLGALLAARGDSISHASLGGAEAAVSARLRGFPLALDIAAGRGSDGTAKFVLGLGGASVAAALAPPSTLANSATRAAAMQTLGGAPPSAVLQFPTLISLLEGIGLTESPPLSGYLPYLRSLATLSGGAQQAGDGVERFRLVVGLRGAGG